MVFNRELEDIWLQSGAPHWEECAFAIVAAALWLATVLGILRGLIRNRRRQ